MTIDILSEYLVVIGMCIAFALGFIAGYRR